jgi:hypothetical protein
MSFIKAIIAILFICFLWTGTARAESDTYCFVDAGPPAHWAPCSSSNPLQTTSSGGGGGAVTVADGADVTLGAKADSVCGTATGTCTLEALIKYLNTQVSSPPPWLTAATWSTNNYTPGTNNPANGDSHGAAWVDVGAVNGVALLAGAGATGTGSPRDTVAQDTTTIAGSAPGTAGTPSANVVSVQGEASMTPVLVTQSAPADPCFASAKTNVPISTASGTLALVAGVSAKKIYVCSLSLITSGAISVSLAEGSGATCGTSAQAGVIGVATNGTAANGLPLAANGGLTLGNGSGTVAATATAANYLCLFQSGTTQMAGNLTYVQQ